MRVRKTICWVERQSSGKAWSGEKYQVSSRLQFTNTAWANLGAPVTATNGQHFYRVSVLP